MEGRKRSRNQLSVDMTMDHGRWLAALARCARIKSEAFGSLGGGAGNRRGGMLADAAQICGTSSVKDGWDECHDCVAEREFVLFVCIHHRRRVERRIHIFAANTA